MDRAERLLILNHLPSPNPALAARWVRRHGIRLIPKRSREAERTFIAGFDQREKSWQNRLHELASIYTLLTDQVVAQRCRECQPKPLQLWATGELPPPPYLTVVGPREPSDYAVQQTRKFVVALAPHCTIVSGLARGLDSVALEAALEAGGKVLAIVPEGLADRLRHPSRLEQAIMANGAIVAERLTTELLTPAYFVYRNRLLAAVADAVLVPEAGERSGTYATARQAIELHRDLFVLPADLGRLTAQGSNRLLRDGANLALDPEDVAASLGIVLTKTGRLGWLRELLGQGPRTVEELAQSSGQTVAEITRELTRAKAEKVVAQDWLGRFVLLAKGFKT